MIIYNNASKLQVLLRMRGSVLPLVFGKVSLAAFLIQGAMLLLRIHEVELPLLGSSVFQFSSHPFSLRWISVTRAELMTGAGRRSGWYRISGSIIGTLFCKFLNMFYLYSIV